MNLRIMIFYVSDLEMLRVIDVSVHLVFLYLLLISYLGQLLFSLLCGPLAFTGQVLYWVLIFQSSLFMLVWVDLSEDGLSFNV